MTDQAAGQISVTTHKHVAKIILDRPKKLNAMTPDMATSLGKICAELDTNTDIRVVIIAGAGTQAFSAGSDMNALGEIPDIWNFRNRVEYAAVVRNIRKPVIAALQGWVLGGGLEIALSADIRIAAKSVQIGAPEVTHGWVGGGGATQLLPRLVGYGQAMHLLLSGEAIDATECLRVGLVEEVVEDAKLEAHVSALAEKIASYSPVATQAVKEATRAALSMPLESGIQYENEIHTICMSDKGRLEGVAAFQKKHK